MKINGLELRFTKTIATQSREYLEIVKWNHSTCYTLASWNSRGNLEFVGDRPNQLDEDELKTFWIFVRAGQSVVDGIEKEEP